MDNIEVLEENIIITPTVLPQVITKTEPSYKPEPSYEPEPSYASSPQRPPPPPYNTPPPTTTTTTTTAVATIPTPQPHRGKNLQQMKLIHTENKPQRPTPKKRKRKPEPIVEQEEEGEEEERVLWVLSLQVAQQKTMP
jgi:hypothetical protein